MPDWTNIWHGADCVPIVDIAAGGDFGEDILADVETFRLGEGTLLL